MRIVELRDAGAGVAELDGSRHEVDLSLVPDAAVGSYVIVHAGYAIERLNSAEADDLLRMFADLGRSAGPAS